MAGLYYIGPTTDGRDTETHLNTEGELTSGFSRLYVQGRVSEKVALKSYWGLLSSTSGSTL